MKHCTQCGHVLGLGRFCTNCGHPVAARLTDPLNDPLEPEDPAPAQADADWRDNTAERTPRPASGAAAAPPPVSPPRTPPVALEAPPPPRFPLFADEVADEVADAPPPPPADPTPASAVEALDAWAPEDVEADELDGLDGLDGLDEGWEDEWEGRGHPRAMWVAGALVLLAALVTGAWFLGNALGGDDPEDPSVTGESEPGQEAVDHTAEATAKAPRTAPPNVDVDGNPTSYDASNMLDGVPETAWRAAGDGSGLKIVFTFPEKTRITEVGLINGYAKEASDESGATLDWYTGHRRIDQVTWNFGVGDVVRQDLEDDRGVQTVEVKAVEVRKVVLKIVTTTPPGDGPAGRNYTAISDVLLAG